MMAPAESETAEAETMLTMLRNNQPILPPHPQSAKMHSSIFGTARTILAFCLLLILLFLVYTTEVSQMFPTLNWQFSNASNNSEQLQQNWQFAGISFNSRHPGSREQPIKEEADMEHQEFKSENKTFEIVFKNIQQNYWMNFANPCATSTKLLLLSMARRDGFEKRKGIRKTWMKDALPTEIIRFLIADPNEGEPTTVQQQLDEEQTEHGDLVFLHGFVDIYQHIHLKWYAGLQWQQAYCANTDWVMKADDDAIVHLRRLEHWTDKKFRQIVTQHPLVYIGYVYFNSKPIRDKKSKWYISESVYPGDSYPDFMQGTVYLTTSATIAAILPHSRDIVGFYLDDVVYTGLLAELANVTRSAQQQHFLWGTSYDEKHGDCEDGVPTALSMWGANSVEQFERHYGRLKSVECRKK